MLNIQQVNAVIEHYQREKGFLKKLTRIEHPAIRATAEHLKSLKIHKGLISNQDLFKINRFFLGDHPVKPGKASYRAWAQINYQNFCSLNYGQVTQLAELLTHPVPKKYSGFATCSKAGYQQFPEHFSKLTREQLDARSNDEKMHEFFLLLSGIYQKIEPNENAMQEINLRDDSVQEIIFNEDHFLALSKLCVEGMLTQNYIDVILKSSHANFFAKSIIYLKHTDALSVENQQFIMVNCGALIIPITHSLVALDKAGLNTLANREILAHFSLALPLHRTIKCLKEHSLLTQKNFDFISAEENTAWLCALEEMPKELITAEIWEGLLNLAKNGNETDFKKDINAYAELLKNQLNVKQIQEDILKSEDLIVTEAVTSSTSTAISSTASSTARSRFFSVTPVNLTPSVADEVPKVNCVSK